MSIGLDTNVLVRYLARDDEAQWARADALIRSLTSEQPGFISLITLVEIFWVLHSRYRLSKPEMVKLLDMLLHTQALTLENPETVAQATRRFADSSADFADLLIECRGAGAGCAYTVTFDENAVKGAGMRLVP